MKKLEKYLMTDVTSIDIDTYLDWIIVENVLNNCIKKSSDLE